MESRYITNPTHGGKITCHWCNSFMTSDTAIFNTTYSDWFCSRECLKQEHEADEHGNKTDTEFLR